MDLLSNNGAPFRLGDQETSINLHGGRRAPRGSLGRVDPRARHPASGGAVADEEHEEGAPATVAVVVEALRRTENRAGVGESVAFRFRQHLAVAGDGVPDSKAAGTAVEEQEDAAVAAVESPASQVQPEERGACCGGNELGNLAGVEAVREAEQGRRSVELAVAAGEGGVGEDAAPRFADEGGAEEAGGVVGWEAEEDLGDGVVDQLGRRRRHGVLRSRAVVGGRNDRPARWFYFRLQPIRARGP